MGIECLAIIPARGGSKGIPRKNVRLLAGKPLIAYSIEQARRARLVNRVVVSTDDAEIAAVSQQYGAEVVWRPAEISGDRASSESALLHALDDLRQREGYCPELLAFLQCTSPLTLAEDIDGTIQTLLDQQADTALAVIPFHYFLWRTADRVETSQVSETCEVSFTGAVGINHDKRVRPLRQEREPQYLETGAVYVMKVDGFLSARHRFFGKTALHVMPVERRLEIDDLADFQVAEVLLRERCALDHHDAVESAQSAPSAVALPEPVAALVLDFDGVFTDNRVIVGQDGRESVICDRGDGWAVAQLKKTGLPIMILSTETNPVVQARADKLGIPCLQGIMEKGVALKGWASGRGIDLAHLVYLGNDVNDLDCLKLAGCGVVTADAHPSAKQVADLVLQRPGGHGALRELCEMILACKQ